MTQVSVSVRLRLTSRNFFVLLRIVVHVSGVCCVLMVHVIFVVFAYFPPLLTAPLFPPFLSVEA